MSHTTCVSPVSGVPARLADQDEGLAERRRCLGLSPTSRPVSLANPLAGCGYRPRRASARLRMGRRPCRRPSDPSAYAGVQYRLLLSVRWAGSSQAAVPAVLSAGSRGASRDRPRGHAAGTSLFVPNYRRSWAIDCRPSWLQLLLAARAVGCEGPLLYFCAVPMRACATWMPTVFQRDDGAALPWPLTCALGLSVGAGPRAVSPGCEPATAFARAVPGDLR
jgi:hypothetical protein